MNTTWYQRLPVVWAPLLFTVALIACQPGFESRDNSEWRAAQTSGKCGNGISGETLKGPDLKLGTADDYVEECDDGNLLDMDGCTFDCKLEKCSDGLVNNYGKGADGMICTGDDVATETCDDKNKVDGDGCSADCTCEGTGCLKDMICFQNGSMTAKYPAGCKGTLLSPCIVNLNVGSIETTGDCNNLCTCVTWNQNYQTAQQLLTAAGLTGSPLPGGGGGNGNGQECSCIQKNVADPDASADPNDCWGRVCFSKPCGPNDNFYGEMVCTKKDAMGKCTALSVDVGNDSSGVVNGSYFSLGLGSDCANNKMSLMWGSVEIAIAP